jgi:hypothetical protein
MTETTPASNDFDPKEFTKTVDQHHTDLVDIKKCISELQDKKLDEKICKAIEDSVHIQNKIGTIVWKTIREKLVWIILTLLALLLWDSIKTLLTNAISKIN